MWNEIFDKIYVVSLRTSADRRKSIVKQFKQAGVSDYEFHDAFGPDSACVKDLLGSEKVLHYPPCFRCGMAACGSDDCNNVLIPPQIATFSTYLQLWEKIAAIPQRALIFEDDVVLHPWWPKVISTLIEWVNTGILEFGPNRSRLIRLGWALCDDHDPMSEIKLSRQIKMSNPCHAMTSTFAARALERFESIYHTVDVVLHRDMPKTGEAVTVFPPIASELSWSTGAFPSLIRPKENRAQYLESLGKFDEAEQMRGHALHHATRIAHKNR